MPLPISVCFVSGAEASRIGPALESVADWTEEIIVVLNEEVADGTEAVARRHGAKVFREPWKGFIGQKNSSAEKASSPWILGMDADERVSPELKAELHRLFETKPDAAAYEFPRCTYYCGRWIRHGDWYPDRVIRLWRRGSARWEGVEPHARLEVKGPVGRLDSDLLHWSNESIEKQISKISPYSRSFAEHRRDQGRGVSFLDLAFRPWWKFFRAYILKAGFLDGWPGYYIAWMSAFSTATRYVMVREAALPPAREQR
jgi:glycosyltransferase involved in cell wall biosynthesis